METNSLASRVAEAEQAVKRARNEGGAANLIAAARASAAQIRDLVPGEVSTASGEERDALIAMKRFLFNAAADCWPGWEINSPPCSEAELHAARDLANQSATLVDALDLGPQQMGTARWMVGAFDLALGVFDEALDAFTQAAALYEGAGDPCMALLARGYCAIAREAARTPASDAGFRSILNELAAGSCPDGAALAEQLTTARRIFV